LVLRRLGLAVWMGVAILVASVVPAAAKASVDRIENVDSVLAVATPEDFPVASLMRAECAWVQRVELPDGSATESQACDLSDEPVMIPEFQGSPPNARLPQLDRAVPVDLGLLVSEGRECRLRLERFLCRHALRRSARSVLVSG
jgi:hypothetical protein